MQQLRFLCFFLFFSKINCTFFIETGNNLTLNCGYDEKPEICLWSFQGENFEFPPDSEVEIQWPKVQSFGHECDLILDKAQTNHHNGVWTCTFVYETGILGPIQDFSVFVINPPLLEIQGDSLKEVKLGQHYQVQCSKIVNVEIQVKIFDNEDNYRTLTPIKENTYDYQPRINDSSLQCQILLGDNYQENVSVSIENILFETYFYNLSENGQLVYCGNPLPSKILIKTADFPIFPLFNLTKNHCLQFYMPEKYWIDPKSFEISGGNLILTPYDRLTDFNLYLYVILPVILGFILIASAILFYFSFRKKWWCFEKRTNHNKNNDEIANSLVISKISCPPSPNYEPTGQVQFFVDHLYEVIGEEKSEENNYDTLDFHRPLARLEGHYQSSKTLKTFSSQEDYLVPNDSKLLIRS